MYHSYIVHFFVSVWIYIHTLYISLPYFSLYLYIQTNVYMKAQYRKMGYFKGFIRKAVVVIPPHHELRKRTTARNKEMGDPVPEDALNAMKGEEGKV